MAIAGFLWIMRPSSHSLADPTAPLDGTLASADRLRPDAIFLVVVDTLRADRLSCYGYESHATPNIDGQQARRAAKRTF